MSKIKEKPRPSALHRTEPCPGSLAAEAPYPWQDSPASNRGRKLHDAMALLLMTGDEAWQTLNNDPSIEQKDMAVLRDCLEFGSKLMPDDPDTEVWVETKLDCTWMGLTGGKADAIFMSKKFQGAVLIDWKFGGGEVDDPQYNRQMQAYACALTAKMKKEGLELQSVEAVIVQPGAWKEDQRTRSHVFSREELAAKAAEIKKIVDAATEEGAPRFASDSACHFCKHKEACPEYATFAGAKAEQKKEAEEQKLLAVTAGTPVEIVPAEPIQTPVVVVSAEVVAQAEAKLKQAEIVTVTDNETAQMAGLLSKDIRGLNNLIEKQRKKVGAPILALTRAINDAAKEATLRLEAAAAVLDKKVKEHNDKIMAEERRRKEAEARRIAEAEKKQAEAEAEERRQREEAARKEEEARRAQEAAAMAANAEARKKAEAEAKRKADEAAKAREAQEAAKKAAEEEARKKAEEENAALMATAQEPQKIAGYRRVVKRVWNIPDIKKVPPEWAEAVLMVNTKAVEAMVKAKNPALDKAEWITIEEVDDLARSR